MTAKQDTSGQASSVQDSGGEVDQRAFKIFRDSYTTFMDEVSRVWYLHCRHLAEASNLAQERIASAGASPTTDAVTAIQNEIADQHRTNMDTLRAQLRAAVQAYAKANASAWTAAGDQKDPEWLMWQVGNGQMNVAAAYSNLARALGT